MTVFGEISIGIGALSAVAGSIRAWQWFQGRRVMLKVVPKGAIPLSPFIPSHLNFCIEVTNLGAPVTINEVGFLYHGTTLRGAYAPPFVIDGGPWPRRLEPRSSVTVYGQRPDAVWPSGHRLKCAYANTECGVRKFGTSPILEDIAGGPSSIGEEAA